MRRMGGYALTIFKRFLANECPTCAGAVAFSSLLALFPFLIFATALAGFIGASSRAGRLVAVTFGFLPDEVAHTLRPIFREILMERRGSLLTLSMIGTAWAASGGIESLRAALNRAYAVRSPRPFWRRRSQGLFLVILAAFAVIFVTLAVVIGPLLWNFLVSTFEVPRRWKWLWPVGRNGFGFLVVTAGALLLYRFLPDRAQRWPHLWPGAVLTGVLWIALANGYSSYLKTFAEYNVVYGPLGGIVITLIFFFVSAAIFLLGGELNGALKAREETRS